MVRIFDDFELDDELRKLTRNGRRIRLTGQSLELLLLLLERPGELITREEVQRSLWPDRSVDFQHSLDVLVSRLRSALGDSAETPRYVETVPRKGYRFLCHVSNAPVPKGVELSRPWIRRVAKYVAVAVLDRKSVV